MPDYFKRTWAVVDLDSIAHNYNEIKKILSPGTMIMGVVKADAYGHGDRYVARELEGLGVSWFGVSNLEEAWSLRTHGISRPILIFGITPPEYAAVLSEHKLTQTIHCEEYARALNESAKMAGVKIAVHVKVDTGMSRLGYRPDDGGRAGILELKGLGNLSPEGIYTHFACADESEADAVAYTRKQYAGFTALIERLRDGGLDFEVAHCCNSAGTIMYPDMHMDIVRPGIALYGLNPGGACAEKIDLKPAMELYSTVSMVKKIGAGTPVSYGRRYAAQRETTVATVQIGYADGFGRELSNKAGMLVRGSRAKVIGTVCMDQLMLDVTGIDGVAPGDVVTVVGGRLSFDEMAMLSGTINYEKACLIGRRVPRVYRRGGKDVDVVDYIVAGN